VGLERGSLTLVSTTELLGRNSSGSGLETREYGREDPLRWPRDTLYQLKLALTSPTGCGRSVGIVRLRTKATEFVCLFLFHPQNETEGTSFGKIHCSALNAYMSTTNRLLCYGTCNAVGSLNYYYYKTSGGPGFS
jgi:hypothetical protein